MISLSIPSLPPSSNHAYTNNGFGGRTLSKEGQRYKRETLAHLTRTYPQLLRFFQPDVSYGIYIRLFFSELENRGWPKTAKSRYKRVDASNRIKLLEDTLKDAAGIDDSQHLFVCVEKTIGEERTEVFAWSLNDDNPFNIFQALRLDSTQLQRTLPSSPSSRTPTPTASHPRTTSRFTGGPTRTLR